MMPRALIRACACALFVLGLLAGTVYAMSEVRLQRAHAVDKTSLDLDAEPGDAQRGQHLALHVAQCGFCHGADLSGREVVDDPWIGRLAATNLTPGRGGIGARYGVADWERSIRGGVAPDGRALVAMPSHHFAAMGDEDLADLIAFLTTLPAVDRVAAPRRVGPLSRFVIVAGLAPELIPSELLPSDVPRDAPARAATAEYGGYLVDLGACRVCHHTDLRGGHHPLALPDEPEPPDLTASGRIAHWSGDEFLRAMRSGRTPEGDRLDARYMPWPSLGRMTDLELRAIWLYLQSLSEAEVS